MSSSPEENKALFRRVIDDVFNQHNLDAVDLYYPVDYIQHNPHVPPGLTGFKEFFAMHFAAFPDLHATIEDLVAEGDKIAARLTWTGTHKGEFEGIPPTGKQIKFTTMEFFRVASGKLAEHWDEVDLLGMLQQIGAIPAR